MRACHHVGCPTYPGYSIRVSARRWIFTCAQHRAEVGR